MGKKMNLPFLSKSSSIQGKSSWPWPSCHQPRTLSFRTDNESLFKTINSTYLDAIIEAETPESWFSNSSESASFDSTASEESRGTDPVETVIRGLRSETERLFFEPGETSSILEEAKQSDGLLLPFKESVICSMESQDPYVDFRKSMEEMVEALGLKDWECLEQLLCWYLRANGKSNHGYIVGAFVDLLVGLALSSSSSSSSTSSTTTTPAIVPSCSNCSHSPSSPLSCYTSSSSSEDSSTTPCVSSSQADEEEIDNSHCLSSLSEKPEEEIIEDKDDDDASSLDV